MFFKHQTKGNNSARQTRDTTTKTWIAYGNSTWHASKYKIYKLHQRYILCDIFQCFIESISGSGEHRVTVNPTGHWWSRLIANDSCSAWAGNEKYRTRRNVHRLPHGKSAVSLTSQVNDKLCSCYPQRMSGKWLVIVPLPGYCNTDNPDKWVCTRSYQCYIEYMREEWLFYSSAAAGKLCHCHDANKRTGL